MGGTSPCLTGEARGRGWTPPADDAGGLTVDEERLAAEFLELAGKPLAWRVPDERDSARLSHVAGGRPDLVAGHGRTIWTARERRNGMSGEAAWALSSVDTDDGNMRDLGLIASWPANWTRTAD